jgi:CRP-like cAMP-binding protein
MDNDDKAGLLAGVPFFSGCSFRELRDIAHLSEERLLTEGSELCRQGDFENEVFLVVDGVAEVIIDGSSVGRTRVGEIVGELAMLGNGRRAATLLVIEPMRVLVFDPREVDSALAADPSSAQRLSQHGDAKSDHD